jgi:hypothetical protein
LRPRREDAPTEAGLRRQRGRGDESADAEGERRRDGLDVAGEPDEAEVGATLRPLARALLALAEQLTREEGP